ncbi:hypothetical protein SAMN04487775_107105 [Treponema bryantii]|uniref:Uncharacterized protein n=1 Tax=Treponema bryantii TaxID=163 RepID=A0A1I3LNU6_9SPIR|nr:hypothetical protein [Treponema bryantii]SFI86387.1 hypothetical protein SAMN04487775_107105 [Treponema bryantii]
MKKAILCFILLFGVYFIFAQNNSKDPKVYVGEQVSEFVINDHAYWSFTQRDDYRVITEIVAINKDLCKIVFDGRYVFYIKKDDVVGIKIYFNKAHYIGVLSEIENNYLSIKPIF